MGSRFGGENDTVDRTRQRGGQDTYGSSYGSLPENQTSPPSSFSYSGPTELSGTADSKIASPGVIYGGINQNPASPAYYPPGSSRGPYGPGPATGFSEAGPVGNMDAGYKFSPAETAVVKECSRESFYYRSLPMMSALSAMTHFAVKGGKLPPHPKYGSLPKVVGAGFFGYVLGKLSYFKECQEKFLRLPESRVGDAIRRRNQGLTGLSSEQVPAPANSNWPQQPPIEMNPQRPFAGYGSVQRRVPPFDTPVQERGTEASSGFNTDDYMSSLDIDSEKNSYFEGGQGDDGRPNSLDSDIGSLPSSPLDLREDPLRSASYDELRRQHRDAYLRPPPQAQREQNRPL